jgi:hypothetical protein
MAEANEPDSAAGSIYMSATKGPDEILIRGTRAGLRSLAMEILEAGRTPFEEPSVDGERGRAVLEHLTRNRKRLAVLLHPESNLRFFGISAFRDPSNDALAIVDRRPVSRRRNLILLGGWLTLLIASASIFLIGLWSIASWLMG